MRFKHFMINDELYYRSTLTQYKEKLGHATVTKLGGRQEIAPKYDPYDKRKKHRGHQCVRVYLLRRKWDV